MRTWMREAFARSHCGLLGHADKGRVEVVETPRLKGRSTFDIIINITLVLILNIDIWVAKSEQARRSKEYSNESREYRVSRDGRERGQRSVGAMPITMQSLGTPHSSAHTT